MRSSINVVAVAAIALLSSGATEAQEKEALFLPQDAQRIDDMTIRGTSERYLSMGLSRLKIPGSETIYYVVNEETAWQSDLREGFADIYRNDSDISIGTDQLSTEFVHLRIRADTMDARLFKVEPALGVQLWEFFRAGGFSGGGGSVDYLEYLFPISSCSGLGEAVERLEALLQESASTIGPVPFDTVRVDGLQYALRVRLGRLMGSFNINQDNGSLFDAVRSIKMTVRECSMSVQPEEKTRDFQ